MESGSWRWDLVGLPLAEAEPILNARGLTYHTTVTTPPNKPIGVGELRVVAQRATPEGLLLVLAYREYQRQEHPPGGREVFEGRARQSSQAGRPGA